MRDFRPSEQDKADIVISELLGSFGDNELSPECLDGALHLMKSMATMVSLNYVTICLYIRHIKFYSYLQKTVLAFQRRTRRF